MASGLSILPFCSNGSRTLSFFTPSSFSQFNLFPSSIKFLSLPKFTRVPSQIFSKQQRHSTILAMDASGAASLKELPHGMDAMMEEEYTSVSKLLHEFTSISTISKAWIFKSEEGNGSRAMFTIGQPNLLTDKKKTHIISSYILKESNDSIAFQWSPFPVEMIGVSAFVPSPSGSKLLIVRNKEDESPTQFEVWSPSQLLNEIQIPQSVHGSIYTDGWFEGISWNYDETLIAYVAEEPSTSKPVFDGVGYKTGPSSDKACGTWKGQGDWEEHWGETYAGKKKPALFVVNVISNEVRAVDGIKKSLSVGQVVWAPFSKVLDQYLVFVGWPADIGPNNVTRKLGIKYCYNRPCALYVVRSPFCEPKDHEHHLKSIVKEGSVTAVNLTQGISSGFFPRFSPDGKFLVFLSAKSSVDSGAHCATNSLHRMDWPTDGNLPSSTEIVDVVPVVSCAENGCFPGLYCSTFLTQPWLSDGCTLIVSSYWGSLEVVLSINVLSGKISRISPAGSNASWDVLALDSDNILAVSSTPISPPQIKYGCPENPKKFDIAWDWSNVTSPFPSYSEEVKSLLSSLQYNIMKIPVKDSSEHLTEGAKKPFEAIFISNKEKGKDNTCHPLIVILHGGPHTVSVSSYTKSWAFLSSLGYNLLVVNYRGSLGFGEEALQSLPGKIGRQDVDDVLSALDHIIELRLADPSKVAVLGGSHGGFLTTHLIGQAPERFAAAAARNPVCNIGLMVGTSDIPDWCYVEAYGREGKSFFTEAPSAEQLSYFYKASPISHLSKVKTPILMLLGTQDLRVPISNGLQYARALKEKGAEVKVIVFPNDNHPLDRPQTDFESFLNIGVWFRKYCK